MKTGQSKAASGLGVLMAVGMATGLLLDVSLVVVFGFTARLDAFILALTVPIVLDTFFRETLRNVLVPHFAGRLADHDRELVLRYLGRLTGSAMLLGCGIGLVLLAVSLALWRFHPGAEAGRLDQTVQLVWLFLAIPPLAFPATILAVFHNTDGRFWIFGCRQIVIYGLPLVALALAVLLDLGIVFVAVGYVLGFAVYLWISIGALRGALFGGQRFLLQKDELRELFDLSKLMVVGIGAGQVARVFERLVSFVLGEGLLAAYYLAFRVYSAIQSIVGMALSTTSLTQLAREWNPAEGEKYRGFINANLLRAGLGSLAFGLAAAIGMLAFEAVGVDWFQLDEERLGLARNLLWVMVISLPLSSMVPILASALYASNNRKAVFGNMILVAASRIVLVFALAILMGIYGIALATILVALLSSLNLRRNVRARVYGWT